MASGLLVWGVSIRVKLRVGVIRIRECMANEGRLGSFQDSKGKDWLVGSLWMFLILG